MTEHEGVPLLVKDIAEVRTAGAPRQGVVCQDERDDIVSGIVMMRKGENPSVVLKALKAKIATLNDMGLPHGVSVVPFYDRSWLIRRTLHTVFRNLAPSPRDVPQPTVSPQPSGQRSG